MSDDLNQWRDALTELSSSKPTGRHTENAARLWGHFSESLQVLRYNLSRLRWAVCSIVLWLLICVRVVWIGAGWRYIGIAGVLAPLIAWLYVDKIARACTRSANRFKWLAVLLIVAFMLDLLWVSALALAGLCGIWSVCDAISWLIVRPLYQGPEALGYFWHKPPDVLRRCGTVTEGSRPVTPYQDLSTCAIAPRYPNRQNRLQ